MLSVLFATHNGAKTLPQMLDAFCMLQIPDGGWEVVAVDNASNDQTKDILRRYLKKLPLKIVNCEDRGKNRALNAGISNLNGDIVVLTDDDILPHSTWLCELEKSVRENPEFDIFGGVILPQWPKSLPSWLAGNDVLLVKNLFSLSYGVTPSGRKEGETEPWTIWGANMVVRRQLFESGNRFNESIGPAAGAYVMGSETEFVTRLYEAGHRCYFNPNATVRHIIRENQLDKRWVLKRAFKAGRGNRFARRFNVNNSLFLRCLGIERWKFRQLVESFLAVIIFRIFFKSDKSFPHEWRFCFISGQIFQNFRI